MARRRIKKLRPCKPSEVIVKGVVWYDGKQTPSEAIMPRWVIRRALVVDTPTDEEVRSPQLRNNRIANARTTICATVRSNPAWPFVNWAAGLDPRLFNIRQCNYVLQEVINPHTGKHIRYDGRRIVRLPDLPTQLSLLSPPSEEAM
jgi:hypothetical protein